MTMQSRACGYSLYELIMTLAIAAVVLTVGLPSFGKVVSNQKLMVETNALFHAVHEARQASVVKRREITLCPTVDGQRCESTTDWSSGWMMFVNVDRDRPAMRDSNERILKTSAVDASVRIQSNRRSFSLRSTELRATNGTFLICDRMNRGTARALVISYTGRPRTTYRKRSGAPVQCAQ